VTFETPLQPVVARRQRQGPRLLAAAALITVALLASHPWTATSPQLGPGSGRAAAAPTALADAITGSPSPSPEPTEVPPLYGSPPPANLFDEAWSIVGVRELASGAYSITQQPVEPRAAPRTGDLEASTCDLGPSPDVGRLPSTTLRLLGAVVPNAGHGWIRLTLLDGSVARAFAVLVTYPPGTEDLAVGLFGTSSYSPWPPGGYRFYAVDDTGTGHYLYACVGD
jgi:hypothetical protein